MPIAKDFYAILGVPKTASDAEIKQAYRKLSKELHPDKHPSTGSGQAKKDAEAKFKEVNEAYEVLSDTKKRGAYDQFGSADFAGFGQGGRSQGFGGFDFSNIDPSAFGGDLGDIFESFFGGRRGGGRRESGRGRDMEVEIEIPFEEAVGGGERGIRIPTLVTCPECAGSGGSPGSKQVTCTECNGTGATEQTTRSLFGMIRQSTMCSKCRGSGKIPEKPCKTCKGEGRVEQTKTVTVRIPAGIDDGQSMRITGEGEAGRQGNAAGDLLVRIHVRPDPRFERHGDDVRSEVSIPVIDAVLGAEISVDTVQAKTTVSIPAGTQPGQVLRLKGKGMPILNTSRHGDHYLTVNVVVPTKISKAERELFERLRTSE